MSNSECKFRNISEIDKLLTNVSNPESVSSGNCPKRMNPLHNFLYMVFQKAIAITKAWKSKQVKRRKPEESDDSQERAVYDAQIAQYEFIKSMNYYLWFTYNFLGILDFYDKNSVFFFNLLIIFYLTFCDTRKRQDRKSDQ